MNKYYLDTNAHLPLNKEALKTYVEVNNSLAGHGHPSSPSLPGREAAKLLEESRAKIAELLGAEDQNQIIFTSNCTQACEWSVFILSQLNKQMNYTSPVEHPAIKLAVNKYLKSLFKYEVDKNGIIQQYEYNSNSTLTCIHSQNETGVIQPLEKLKKNVLLSDMSQSAGKIDINLSEMPIDAAVFGAHKFSGPGNVGLIYLKETDLWSEFGTGSRYFLDRPGTPDVAGVVSAAKALEEAIRTLPERQENMLDFRNTLEKGLKQLDIEIIGENANRVPNTTFFKVPGSKAISLLTKLGEDNIHVALGSACSSNYVNENPTMTALGYGGDINDYMRISTWGEYNSKDAEFVLNKLKKHLDLNEGEKESSKN